MTAKKRREDKGTVKASAMRKFWCTVWVGLGLALCLAGCQGLFPRPVYSPPMVQAPPPPPPSQVVRPTFYVAGNNVRLRACPAFDCPIIASMNRDEEVEKVGDADNWSQIRVKRDGTIGWVSSRYLSATPVAAPSEVAPPPTPPEALTPPPLPEMPEKAKPTPSSPPAVEKPPKPAKPTKPAEVETPAPEQPIKPEKPVKPVKPAPEPPVVKPTPPEKPAPPTTPEPEKPSKIRIM